jgi:hypothetical protein
MITDKLRILSFVELLPSTFRLYLIMKVEMEGRSFQWTTFWLVKLGRRHQECSLKLWYVLHTWVVVNTILCFEDLLRT